MAVVLATGFNALLLILCIAVVKTAFRRWGKAYPPLPPGPKRLPVIGNLLDMPSETEWLTFAEWGEQWGDISSVTILGQHIVILNSMKAAKEMLDKKSNIYSDRAEVQMGGNLVGWKNTLIFIPYGDRFRRFRRLLNGLLGSRATVKRFSHDEELETRKLLRRLLAKPEDVTSHVRHTTGAIILQIGYGYKVQETNDPFVELVNMAMHQFSTITAPGAGYLVDTLPLLRYVPAWFPGAEFQRTAKACAATLVDMVEKPHNFVKGQMAAGIAPPSFSHSLMDGKTLSADEESDVKWCSATLYAAGADTTVSAINSFFLAMTLFPEVAKKAQAEIDAVVGNDRLPTFEDRPDLPYLDALTKEVLRWHSVAPTSVPHRVMEDDIHDGYFIPKGTLVIANLWKLTHDPKVYAAPEVFNPDRFIATEHRPAEPDPRDISFGFGRRICPGLHLADASVYIACAMSLAVFDIKKQVKNGVVIEPVHEYTTGTASHPKPFECSIEPRSQRAVALIQADGDL